MGRTEINRIFLRLVRSGTFPESITFPDVFGRDRVSLQEAETFYSVKIQARKAYHRAYMQAHPQHYAAQCARKSPREIASIWSAEGGSDFMKTITF